MVSENVYIYGKEGKKLDYAFLLTEKRGAIRAESQTPAHIPEIILEYKKSLHIFLQF